MREDEKRRISRKENEKITNKNKWEYEVVIWRVEEQTVKKDKIKMKNPSQYLRANLWKW